MKTLNSYIKESKNAQMSRKFTPQEIELLKKSYGSMQKIDPTSKSYKSLIDLLDDMPQDGLKQLAQSNIKFVSPLAKNRLKEGCDITLPQDSEEYEDMVRIRDRSAQNVEDDVDYDDESSPINEDKELDSLIKKYENTGRVAFVYPKKKMVSLSGGKAMSYEDAKKKIKELLSIKESNKHMKNKKIVESSGPNFPQAAPAGVSGGHRSVGLRDPNSIKVKFAMLLKDTSEEGTELRLLVTYPNGDSMLIPKADEQGAQSEEELLMVALEVLGDDITTVDVVRNAILRSRANALNESALKERMGVIAQAFSVLKQAAPHPTGMTKVEAVNQLVDKVPHNSIVHALMDAGHDQDEIEQIFFLAGVDLVSFKE